MNRVNGAIAIAILASLSTVAQASMAEPLTKDIRNNEQSNSIIPSQLIKYSNEGRNVNSTAQNVTSVSQLSDVRPTDWAFTALQSLVERYGCIAGYPDRTYRGQRAMTRYEFAAGLNACLDKINELISSGLADKVSKADLAALQKLQEEFATELATLRGRVDALEAKTAKIEAQQFSTTTKLEGEAIFSVTGGSSGTNRLAQPALDAANQPVLTDNSGKSNTTFISRVRLDLNTSFTGEDLLTTRLQSGNNGGDFGSLLDAPEQFLGFTGFSRSSSFDYSGAGNSVTLDRLRYDFSVGKDIRVSVGPVISLNDHLDANSFANDEAADFSIGMFINNPLILPVNDGAGGAITWNPSGGAFSFRAGYVAAESASPRADDSINKGLFGDPYQATAELEFAPKNGDEAGPFAIRLQYTTASVNNIDYSIGGVNLEWAIARGIAVFGRYGFGSLSNRGKLASLALPTYVNASSTVTTLNPSTWSAGLAFPDLFRVGALGAIAVGQPFVEGNVGNATQTNIEAFYRIPVSDNISISPDLQFIFNPNNNTANSTVTIGSLRAVFSF